MDALATVQSLYPSFTKTEKKLIDYILSDPDSHIYLSLTLDDLATQAGVGQASVMRLIKKCGYPTFRSFMGAMHQAQYKNATSSRLASRQAGNSLVDDVTRQLSLCAENLDQEYLRLAAQCIRNADFVVCVGYGNSSHVASLVAARMRRENIFCTTHVPGEIILSGYCAQEHKRAVVLCFSVSGETTEVIQVAQRYAQHGSCVIAITSHVESTLAKMANLTFYAPSKAGRKGHQRDLEGIVTPLFAAESIIEEYYATLNEQEET